MEFFLYLKTLLKFFFVSFFVGTVPWTFQKQNGLKVSCESFFFYFFCQRTLLTFFFTSFFLVTAFWTFLKINGLKFSREEVNFFFFLFFLLKNVTNVFFYFFFCRNGSLDLSDAKWIQG